MKTSKALARMIPVLAMAVLLGCSKPRAGGTPFVHEGAVFRATAGGDATTSPVERNYSVNEEGRPKGYSGTMLLRQGAIQIRYEFVGTALCPVSADGETWDDADVYVVAITGKGTELETIPVVYRGEKTVIVERPDLQVVLGKGDSGQAPSANPADGGG